ncbi:MAG: hypothetical protein JSV96_18765 [Candidatus Aminicenantes bacterium]|nr:MAG: hypothetical protein JSV96_18765 [Candidatus Aminicenantes bacterium]
MAGIVEIVLIILTIGIALIALFTSIGNMTFKQKVKKEVKEILMKSRGASRDLVIEEDIKELPEPVQRYLRYIQIIGKEKIRTVRLKQKGFFRQKENQKWMPFKAEQYYTTNPPASIWFGKINPLPFFSIKARDMYFEGKGNMLIKLQSLFTIADAKGKEMDEATLVRFLNESFWFPTVYLNNYIRWETIDANSAKAIITDQGVSASAILYFNEKGEMINFVAERFITTEKQYAKWSTPIKRYKELNGIRIPTEGEGIWHLSSGDFSYIRLEITEVEYNHPL